MECFPYTFATAELVLELITFCDAIELQDLSKMLIEKSIRLELRFEKCEEKLYKKLESKVMSRKKEREIYFYLFNLNKTGTSKVGAISKARKAQIF